ncbi:MAG: S-adenosylmethionine:tRNA ribosyltransferase-isomerase, partial [Bacteroidetes bacterium]
MLPTGQIKIEDYNYPLPNERIAKFPLENREQSKLLCLKGDKITQRKFFELPELL